MIEINIHSGLQELSLSAKGHALFAPKGKDLVCCGVSTLLQSWIIATIEICKVDMIQHKTENSVEISYRHKNNSELLLRALVLNLGLMQKQYPQNLKVKLEEIHGT